MCVYLSSTFSFLFDSYVLPFFPIAFKDFLLSIPMVMIKHNWYFQYPIIQLLDPFRYVFVRNYILVHIFVIYLWMRLFSQLD